MTSRQIPSFLKRAAKKDTNPSVSSTSSSSSSAGASRSIRFSSLGSNDYDIFSSPASSASQMSHPLELLADKEEPAEEAILVNFAAADAPLEIHDEASPAGAEAACESLSRPPSVSAPPDVTPHDVDYAFVDSAKEGDEEDATAKEDSEELEQSGESMTSAIKKTVNVKSCVESSDILDDIDKTFENVPKPANKPRKLPSAYAKPRSKASVTKVAVARTTEPLLDLEQEEHDLELCEKTSQASSVPAASGAACNSIFDQEDPTLDSHIPLSASAPDLEEIRQKADSPNSTSLQASKESSPVPISPPTPPPAIASVSVQSHRKKISPSPSFQTSAQAPKASRTSPPPTPPTSSTSSFTSPSSTASPQEAQDPPVESHRDRPGANFEVLSLFSDKRFILAAAFALSAICLRVLPSVSFFIGFFWGAGMVLGLSYLYKLLNTRSQPRELFQSVPELRDLPPPNIPHVVEEPDDGGGIFRSWLNELNVYVPESYHINQTSSVYVSLDGTQLRIQRPKQSIQKRAMWNEVVPAGGVNFIHQRHFEMMGAKVSLEPAGLVKKRVWSKKYPICIEFPVANVVGTASASSRTSRSSRRSQGPPSTDDFEWVDEKEVSMERTFLFARTCREKEEWFRRFEAAAKGKPLQLSIRRIVSSYLEEDRNSVFAASNAGSASSSGASDPSGAASTSVSFSSLSGGAGSVASGGQGASASEASGVPLGSGLDQWSDRLSGSEREPLAVTYTRYMARFMPADWLSKAAKSHRLSVNYISCDPQVLWLNAILGRGVWDLLREKIWADKVKQKIQNKLRKIHVSKSLWTADSRCS